MAPTVCLTELPMTGSTVCPYVCQRQRVQNSTNIKRQILRLRQMLRNASKTPPMSQGNSLWRLEYANIEDCFISNRIRDFSTNMDEHTEKLVMAKKGMIINEIKLYNFSDYLSHKIIKISMILKIRRIFVYDFLIKIIKIDLIYCGEIFGVNLLTIKHFQNDTR